MIIDKSNINEYFENSVLPKLFSSYVFVKSDEVKKHTYVNNIHKVTLACNNEARIVYLRQALPYIKAEPLAKVNEKRIVYEEKVLNYLYNLFRDDTTPEVIFSDHENNILILSDVGQEGTLLVDDLEKGKIQEESANSFAKTLSKVHSSAWMNFPEFFNKETNDKQLEKHYYNRLQQSLDIFPSFTKDLIQESKKANNTLVIGDFASKNIFIKKDSISFVDLERSFFGDPAFDVGFLFGHYFIEACNQPKLASTIVKLHDDFQNEYGKFMEESQKITNKEIEDLKRRSQKFIGTTMLYRLYGRAKAGKIEENSNNLHYRIAKTFLVDELNNLKPVIELISNVK